MVLILLEFIFLVLFLLLFLLLLQVLGEYLTPLLLLDRRLITFSHYTHLTRYNCPGNILNHLKSQSNPEAPPCPR